MREEVLDLTLVNRCAWDLVVSWHVSNVLSFSDHMYITEVESRTQGSRPRPRTQKKSEAKAKDIHSEDRPSRSQGQECSRPRPRTKDTAASVLEKKGLQKSFSGNLQFVGKARSFDWGKAQTTNLMQ